MSGEPGRAPWAAPVSGGAPPSFTVLPSSMARSGPAPGAGASLTRAPWATSEQGGPSAGMAQTRAPWAQGVSVPGSQPMGLDFERARMLHPEYYASLAPALAAASSTAATPATADTTSAAAASSSSAPARKYSAATKVMKTPSYLPLWKQTAAYAELTGFVLLLNEVVRGVKVKPHGQPSKKYVISPKVQLVVDWLTASRDQIRTIPPIQQSMRYGNKAFRTWHEKMVSVAALAPMLHALLGEELVSQGAADELVVYLQDSFGSLQRIDYGTGHELNFVLWLCAVNKLGVFQPSDHVALVLEVFRHYILLMEELQSVYWLEPAGSKGAWGLDDYQFLIFLWGSSQLIGSALHPADILKETVVESHKDAYLFLLGISFIHRMKTGPFYEHSAFLHQISGLPNWQKANGGLIKMYEEEVLNKHPIVQHICFGRILQFRKVEPGERLAIADAMEARQQAQEKKTLPPVPKFEDEQAREEEDPNAGDRA